MKLEYDKSGYFMRQPKREYSSEPLKTRQKPDPEMMELAKYIDEVLNEDSQKRKDPFELYTAQLRMRVHKDVKTFQSRFIRGYEVLLEHVLLKNL